MTNEELHVAYFSMEFALDDRFKNYAGGLGVLAADAAHSLADKGIPAACVTMWYHQHDSKEEMLDPSPYMKKRDETIEIDIEDRKVKIAIWQYDVVGRGGHIVPIFFLSSYSPDNRRWDRDLTKHLYAPDRYTRLGQEAILGIGGYLALKKLGYSSINYYHMNEGHTALIGLERLRSNGFNYDVVRSKSTFTTHTPVEAGHDYFDYHLAQTTLGSVIPPNIKDLATRDNLGMTQLAMNLSIRTNSVSKKHQQVTRDMFPGHEIENVTNGIYHPRWAGDAMKELFNTHFPGWEDDPKKLEGILSVPGDEVVSAHKKQKKEFLDWLNAKPECFEIAHMEPDDYFKEDILTIGFARRFVPYKRPDLIFRNIDRLRDIGFKKLQLVFAGRCHEDDMFCNKLRDKISYYGSELRGQVKIAVIPDYDLDIAKRLITGTDAWLNNPVAPREASGTSGMKAALNGGLNLSVLDGWWIEGFEQRPMAGWGIPASADNDFGGQDNHDSTELLDRLQEMISVYYDKPEEWKERMKNAIALGANFNTHRMIDEYMERMWKKPAIG